MELCGFFWPVGNKRDDRGDVRDQKRKRRTKAIEWAFAGLPEALGRLGVMAGYHPSGRGR